MKVRTISACVSAALFISFSASTVFADVSLVTDRGSLIPSDAILWNLQGTVFNSDTDPDPNEYLRVLYGSTSTPNVFAQIGTDVAASHVIDPTFEIYSEPSSWFRDSNFADEDYLLSTFAFGDGFGDALIGYSNNDLNPTKFVFSDTSVETGICGFGTQIAPYDLGAFTAEIQASDGDGPIGSPFVVTGSDGGEDGSAAFIGLSSTTPLTSVDIVVTSTGGDVKSWYAINQVTLTYCSDLPPVEPEIPALTCVGFAAPMANHPVKAKMNRVFPLKMELFDGTEEQTDGELVAAPVVTVDRTPTTEDPGAEDISALSAGQGSDGNQFDFTDDGIWQFNLKSKGLASGTYVVTVTSGDPLEYVIDAPTCETSFIIK